MLVVTATSITIEGIHKAIQRTHKAIQGIHEAIQGTHKVIQGTHKASYTGNWEIINKGSYPTMCINRGLKPTHSTHQPEVDYCNKYSNLYSRQPVTTQRFLSYCDPSFRPTLRLLYSGKNCVLINFAKVIEPGNLLTLFLKPPQLPVIMRLLQFSPVFAKTGEVQRKHNPSENKIPTKI